MSTARCALKDGGVDSDSAKPKMSARENVVMR
jgi:hypothetical protein